MLLIDGVKYRLWAPPSEDDFEQEVGEHASEIFGEASRYFDLRHKLISKAGTGSIPDGYVITFGDKPQVHIIELELASHTLQHIVSQVVNIISGVGDASAQQKICNRIEDEISRDEILNIKIIKAIKPASVHRFLSDYFSNTRPMINVVIDKNSPTLEEALNRINYPHRVIEFQTFVREGAETVRAHFFEPLYQVAAPEKITKTGLTNEALTTTHKIGEYVTIKDLIDSSILKVGQIFYRRYKGQRYECKVLNDGGIELIHTGTKFPSINATTNAVTGTAWDAWYFWRTTRENGTECQLEELRKEYRAAHP